MALGNMRALGITSIYVTCAYKREAIVDAFGWPDAIEIRRCTGASSVSNAEAVRSMCARIGPNTVPRGMAVCN